MLLVISKTESTVRYYNNLHYSTVICHILSPRHHNNIKIGVWGKILIISTQYVKLLVKYLLGVYAPGRPLFLLHK